MASQSLYRKWRSQTFSELVGQEAVIRTLKNALNSGKLAHAYLFTGPRGTGKTSTARLLAKTINCPHAHDGEPCNECQQCREITAGNSFNVIEIDAASNRGIDSIRELREKVMMPPSTGKYKVYILDEAHMLTTEAFNALLKTLEEPPGHAIFVMATTDVHKMLPTVLSRCQRFDFKRITTRQIVAHLNFVAGQEDVKLEPGAAGLIARAASGGMRDALSLLDQAIAYAGQEIALTQVQAMLGVADPRAIQKFVTCIAQLDSPGGLHGIHDLAEAGADLRQINTQIADYWRAMMLARAGADIAAILDATEDEIREIVQAAQQFALEELTECARIFAQNELMQKSLGTPQLGLELGLLACIELHRRTQGGQPALSTSAPVLSPRPVQRQEPPRATEAVLPQPPSRPPSQISPQEEVRTTPPVTLQVPPPRNSEEPAKEAPDWDDLPYVDDDEPIELAPPAQVEVVSTPRRGDSEPAKIEQIEPSDESKHDALSLTIQEVKEKWEYVKRRVKTRKDGAKIAAVLNGYTIFGVEQSAGLPVVLIRANAAFHYTAIQKSDYLESIEWAMKVELGQECGVRLLPPSAGGGVVPLPPPMPDSSNHSANTMMKVEPRPPAHRERSSPEKSTPSKPSERVEEPRRKQEDSTSTTKTPMAHQDSSSLARNHLMRENTTTMGAVVGAVKTNETQHEYIKKKATGDPVVRKVVEMFKAEIKEIRPK